jgi:hypothetical protein
MTVSDMDVWRDLLREPREDVPLRLPLGSGDTYVVHFEDGTIAGTVPKAVFESRKRKLEKKTLPG